MRPVEEKQFTVAGRTLAALYFQGQNSQEQNLKEPHLREPHLKEKDLPEKHQQHSNNIHHKPLPIIALHGWLDNANSFQPLAQSLPEHTILSLDLAGHGKSAGRSPDSGYNLWQDVWEILDIVEQMGWQRFYLMGHSRGAMIAVLLSAVTDGVQKLALIDGLVPLPIQESEAPQQLAQAIADRRKYMNHRRRRYSNRDDALAVRLKGPFPLQRESAQLFAERGLGHDQDGYFWLADPRLQAASDVKYSEAQLRAFIEQIDIPVKLFLGRDNLDIKERLFASYWQQMKTCDTEVLDGSHHLHMERSRDTIAERLADYFQEAVDDG